MSNWIKVEDELPPNNIAVLVTGKNIFIDVAWRFDGNNYEWCKFHGCNPFEIWQTMNGGNMYQNNLKIKQND